MAPARSQTQDNHSQTTVASRRFFYLVALVLLVITLVFAGYWWWRQTWLKEQQQEQFITESLELVEATVGSNNFPLRANLDQSGLYHFYVVIDDLVQLDQDYELPDGKKITTLLKASYHDATGELRQIYFPYYTYDPVNLRHFDFGTAGRANNFKSLKELEDLVETSKNLAKEENLGIMTLSKHASVKPGEIRLIGFGMRANPLLDDGSRKFFQDAVPFFHNSASLESFAQDGNPSHLPKVEELGEPLLVHLMANGDTVYQNYSEQ